MNPSRAPEPDFADTLEQFPGAADTPLELIVDAGGHVIAAAEDAVPAADRRLESHLPLALAQVCRDALRTALGGAGRQRVKFSAGVVPSLYTVEVTALRGFERPAAMVRIAARRQPDASGEAEQHLLTLARLVPGVIYQFRRAPDGSYALRYASDAVRALLGLSPGAAEADFGNIRAILHPDDLERLLRSIEHSAATMRDWREDLRIRHGDGSVHWVMGHSTPTREADGSIVWHGYLADITAQKQAEQALRDSAAHLDLALAYARVIPWYWDTASDELKTIRKVRPIYRDRDGRVRMHRFMAMVHGDDRASVEQAFRDKLARPDHDTIHLTYRACVDGAATRWFEIIARARIENGVVEGFFGITADIDARRRAEIEQDSMRAQLVRAQKMESIGQLTGGIAHDFNNILSSILGYCGLALRRLDRTAEPKLVEYLGEVQHAGESARDLVNQLLTFSRAESTATQAVDVAAGIDDALRLLRPTTPSTLAFAVEIQPGLPAALADPVQLQQALVNLCINARDATGGRGVLRMAAAHRQFQHRRCASCHADFNGEFVAVSVTDEGPGIDPARVDRLFEPFFTTKTNGGGSGMGLAMVHGMVHAHHGHVLLETRPGEGARFEILLPTAAPVPAGHGDAAVPDNTDAHTPRVLVVDDEPAVVKFVAELLELEGFEVDYHGDPRVALEIFRGDPRAYDAVVSDQTMPGLTGLELARVLLQLRPDLPVILVSGYSATVSERDALDAGIKAYLPKPIDEERLVGLLRRYTARDG